jgi:hypothetical protein
MVAMLCAWIAGLGCTTGQLLQAGRYHEEVASYERAFLSADRLLLEYVVEFGDRGGAKRGSARREVALRLEDLRADPGIAVEDFPVQRLALGESLGSGTRPLEVISRDPGKAVNGRGLVVEVEGRRPVGFSLVDGEGSPARFHSGALYRPHYRWWVYPLLPFTAALDLLLLVPQVTLATPLFVLPE